MEGKLSVCEAKAGWMGEYYLQRGSERQVLRSSRQLGRVLSSKEQDGTMVCRRRSAHAVSRQAQKSSG